MSTNTRKPKISKKSVDFVNGLKSTDDMYHDYDRYVAEINKSNDNRKRRLATEIGMNGEEYINEINDKYESIENDRITKIEHIYNLVGEKYGTLKELNKKDHSDIIEIYTKVVNSKKSFFKKLIDLFF